MSLQLPPTSMSYTCEHIEDVCDNNSDSRSVSPSSMPSCFNFTVPKSLATCPECFTYYVGSPFGYSQTFKATPRENQSSFLCLPFGPCNQNNVRPLINHSTTQTSSEMQSLRLPNQLNRSKSQESRCQQSKPPCHLSKPPFHQLEPPPCHQVKPPSSLFEPPSQQPKLPCQSHVQQPSQSPPKGGCSLNHH